MLSADDLAEIERLRASAFTPTSMYRGVVVERDALRATLNAVLAVAEHHAVCFDCDAPQEILAILKPDTER